MANIKLSDFQPFRFAKVANVLNLPAVYTNVLTFSENLVAGTYLITVSVIYSFTAATTSAYLRYTGSEPVPELILESKDPTDIPPLTYTFPVVWAGGLFTLNHEMRKETAAGTLNVLQSAIMVKRVL